ncbi:hypothetical protein CCYS_02650 [Corynebacterium cystitidis DSM 20524]|uniref:TIGR03943 family protein n=2 Tax=Corynebacterium cystitidis TaxID=35757 RepID=A0A1H9RAH0_9CORY|nr:hypothetical protein CCYS_02650 [Corynebacterium cystitidis DSM 20524]SER69690.1 TIGR03943 family protein [Corynebacterium cystitidis DSM 20524]SNV86887.1 Uncharacterised protein [Corynebacterium cystitidis]
MLPIMSEGSWAGFIAAATGVLLCTLALTGAATDYVRPFFVPLILVAGVVLLIVGIWTIATVPGSGRPRNSAWAVVVVVALALLAAPGSLGSYFVDTGRVATTATAGRIERPEGDVRLDDLVAAHSAGIAEGAHITVEGFAGRGAQGTPSEGRWFLARYVITCCVADATGVRITLLGPQPEQGQWYRASGRVTTDDHGEAALDVVELERIDEPEVAYL